MSSGACVNSSLSLPKAAQHLLSKFQEAFFASQTSEGSGDFEVPIDELVVEIGKAKEGLNVFDFA
jgi:hypothetical protein